MADEIKKEEEFVFQVQTKESRRTQNDANEEIQAPLQVTSIKLDQLVPFKDHPFKLYDEKRMIDFVDDIRLRGITNPINVRPLADGKYEIIEGHNRIEGSKKAGLDSVPAIIRENLSDEDACIQVVRSNYSQRSMKDMKPSDLANSLYMLNEALKKKPGYRSDLEELETGSQKENRSRTMHVIGEMHNMSQAKIHRYIRIAKLSKGLQDCLDSKELTLGVAVDLSYLRPKEQKIIQGLLKKGAKINAEQAKILHNNSVSLKTGALSEEEISAVLKSDAPVVKKKAVKVSEELFSKYFSDDQDQEEIENEIAKALEFYRSNQSKS